MQVRWWRNAEEKASDFALRFPPQSDAVFLDECGLPADAESTSIALAVRRSVASYGAVTADCVRADHSYPGDLELLSGWDSLDFVGWVLELERELQVPVDGDWFRSLTHPFSVRDLARLVHSHLHSAA